MVCSIPSPWVVLLLGLGHRTHQKVLNRQKDHHLGWVLVPLALQPATVRRGLPQNFPASAHSTNARETYRMGTHDTHGQGWAIALMHVTCINEVVQ